MVTRVTSQFLLILVVLVLTLTLWWTLGPVMPVTAAPLDLPLSDGDAISGPALIEPAEAEVFTATTAPPIGIPTLKWRAVADADRYHVQISAAAGFGTTVVDEYTYANSYTPEIAFADGIYYWRVQAEDNRRDPIGNWSEVRTFAKDWCDSGNIFPALLGPLDQTQISSFSNDHFHWDIVPGAATYKLEIATDDTFSTLVYEAETIKPHHTPVERLANNRYYWRVWPVDHQGNLGQQSPTWSFVFSWDKAPQPIGPDDNIITKFLPTFSWKAVEAAKFYVLEISTEPFTESAGEVQANSVIFVSYKTANTDFTPEKALSNDQEYYWHVKAIDNQGTSSPYSPQRKFEIDWNTPPVLLTPLNGSRQRSYPFFSWTAVPGIERYQIQIDTDLSLDDRPIADEEIYNATSYAQPDWKTVIFNQDYYWRVRGIDAQDNYTDWSEVRSFRISKETSPNHIYPHYYYQPDAESMPVHTDRTIAWPVFVWDTAFMYEPDADSTGQIVHEQPEYYLLEVSSDPAFRNIDFAVETAGLSAAPTADNPFPINPADGPKIYYWRVRAFRSDDTQLGVQTVWQVRIDRNANQFDFVNTITPMYPQDGFEAVEVAPTLGWLPVKNAVQYRVQVSRNSDFSAIVDEAIAQFVNYAPWQGRREAIPFGTYYWRVRAENGAGAPIGDWSMVRHYNVSRDLVNGNPNDFIPPASSILATGPKYDPTFTYIADSPNRPVDQYDVGKLHIMLDRVYNGSYNWVFGFEVAPSITGSLYYGIYVDADHEINAGAPFDPAFEPIETASLYRPEYVIYLKRDGQTIDVANSYLYSWNGNTWDPPSSPWDSDDIWFDPTTSTVQVLVPYTLLGAGAKDFVGSLAVTVFSTDGLAEDGMRDSVPEQGTIINRPAFVSDMLMPLYPFDTPILDPKNPIVFTELPSVRWRTPYFDSVDGYKVEVARDVGFTDIVETWQTHEDKTWSFYSLLPATFHSVNAYNDNESYYWRVSIRHERYTVNENPYDDGPWSPPMRFKLTSLPVGKPTVSTGETAQTTPSFSWQRVEGAAGYTLQVDDDKNFSDPIFDERLDSTAYTPLEALPDGTYFWRVAMRRADKIRGQWTPTMEFTKRSVAPVPVAPVGGVVINSLPTFMWEPVLYDTTTMRMAAPRYRLQFDNDANFSQPDTFDTESTAFTISKETRLRYNKFNDGQWYWRVAVIDAEGNVGAYSAAQSFYKEYLRPVLIGPRQGQSTARIPNFRWEPLDGAAYYEVRVAENENEVDSTKPAKTDNTSYTPTDRFNTTNLFWRVQMFDDDGIPGPSVDGRLAGDTNPLFLPMISNTFAVYQ